MIGRLRRVVAAGAFVALSSAAFVSVAPPASAAVPPAPTLKSAAGGPTTGNMTLKWGVAPTSAHVTSYKASVSTDLVNWTIALTFATGTQTNAPFACPAAKTIGSGCWYRIYAINSSGQSAASNVVLGKWAAPTKPQNVRANAGPLAGKATITYAAPANNGGVAVTQYRYEYSLDGVSWTLGSSVAGTSGTLVVSWCGVAVSSCYFRLRAQNAIGLSLPSASDLAVFDVPAAVQTISSSATSFNLATGTATVTINWNAPDTNGLGIDAYEMQFCPGYGACEDTDPFWLTAPVVSLGNVLTTTTTCPVDATTCAYKIRAHNALGWGQTWRHQFLRPFEPTAFDAFTGSLPGSVDLQWAPPLDGGAGNLSYQVFRCRSTCNVAANWSGLTPSVVNPGNALSVTDPTCGEGSVCTYRISVKDGTGAQSLLTATKTATGSLFASPPGNFTATTGATQSGRVDLAWSPSTAPNGLPVINYLITRVAGNGSPTLIATLGSGVTTYADTTCGATVTCVYVIQAENATGIGSGALAFAIGAGAPLAPQSLTAVPGTTLGGVSLAWLAPSNDGGHAVQNYTVSRISPNAGLVGTTAALSIVDPSCGAAVTCQYKVSATNSIGTGPQSNAATTTGTDVPGVPTGLSAASTTTKGAIKLTWTAPVSNGGRPVIGYLVERQNGANWDAVGSASTAVPLSYTDVSCGAGNLCAYRVSAVNVAGAGAASSVSSATGSTQSVITFSSSAAINVQGTKTPLSGDYNGDGLDDILWYVPGTGAESMFLAAGGGNFVNGPAINVNGTYTPLVGDFDGDGATDIIWYAPGTASDTMWLSNGNGTFRKGPTIAVSGTYKAFVGDFDGNGKSDVFWYAPGAAGDTMWLATSGGAFKTSTQRPNVNGTYIPIVGSFSGDTKSDVLWYAPGSGSDSLMLSNGDGSFHKGPSVAINSTFVPLKGDYDGDSIDDIFWYAPGSGSEALWLGSASGAFDHASPLLVGGVYAPVVGDYDGNAKSDIDWYSATNNDTLWRFL